MTTTILKQKHTFSSDIENLATVEGLVDKICVDYKIKDEVCGNILVAITEAVNNAINHGNKGDATKSFTLEYTLSDKHLSFRVEDMGEGFDYENVPDPTDPENLSKPNGRGIFIMKNLTDEVHFEESGKIVNLKFYFR